MDTNTLFYKIQKGIVVTEDYVKWSCGLIESNVSTPSLNIIASFSFSDNVIEVEDYFKRALNELKILEPSFETSAKGYIGLLARKILQANESEMFNLAKKIFEIVGTELNYPDDLLEWYEISEMIDRLHYDNLPLDFNKEDVISRIKKEANSYLRLNK
ncbi:hypothetical protein [Ornithinibacillus bavariensis]|uniref:hypothetical protein n=1 Tax=Ornithinibacillus bavariensis TaxID=545502 RepID=UPI000ED65955|nr:hypothetical protein [Ornithinibacillus sp.]